MTKLTKRMIDSIRPGEKDIYVWDSDLTGFGIRTKPSGVKSFMVQYRNENGRSRRVTIGKYGHLTLNQARRLAQQQLGDVAKGVDVAQQKANQRKAVIVRDLTKRYMAEHAEVKKKPASISRDRRLIERFIDPQLGNMTIIAVKREDIARLHHGLRNTPTQANRVLALASKMFNLAECWGLRSDGTNPCRHIERYREKKRERYLDGDELARLGRALVEAEKEELPSAILAIRLIMFTGARRSEILTLRWVDVDIDRRVINLPDSKTGAKTIPLPAPAVELLENAPRLRGNPYVCFGDRLSGKTGGHLVGIHRIWNRIREKAGLEDVRIHDLRHSFASVAAAANLGLPIIGSLLGHNQPATTARYTHLYLDPLREASSEIARRIDEAMKKEPKKPAKVVDIKRRR